jgi:hypothetical protein
MATHDEGSGMTKRRVKTHAERQAAYRARKAAEVAAMKAALSSRDPAPTAPTAPEVLQALTEIRRAIQAFDNRVAQMQREEHGPMILRRLTALERAILGNDIGQPPRHTRRRPLGSDA